MRALLQVGGQFLHAGGRNKLAAFAGAHHGLHDDFALETHGGVGGTRNAFEQVDVLGIGNAALRLRQGAGLLRGLNNGLVAGAAAQVAADGVGNLAAAGRGGCRVRQMRQAHDKTRGTKATLRAVAIDHGLLHRVQRAIGLLQTFYGFDAFAV